MNLFYVAIEQSDSQLEVELKKADVVCIVYAVDDEDTLDSGTHGLIKLHTLQVNDLLRSQKSERDMDEVTFFNVGFLFLYTP